MKLPTRSGFPFQKFSCRHADAPIEGILSSLHEDGVVAANATPEHRWRVRVADSRKHDARVDRAEQSADSEEATAVDKVRTKVRLDRVEDKKLFESKL